jgi:isoleucyl-tRNA synthetase
MTEQPKKPGYRDTLNLPETAFPMKADLAKREPDRLAAWKQTEAYARLRVSRQGRPLWLLHDGPPYSNNHIHMGTAANKIWKDAAVRQASLQGFDAPYVPGWDNHGMPIETQVGREFADRKHKPTRLELRTACREYAQKWVNIQREEFIRLGGWGDWYRPYLTMAPEFEAEILETLGRLHERGFIQRGKRAIHWCPTDRTALAMAEIEYADVPSPSLFVRFPVRHDAPAGVLARWPGVSAVVWTTTPWTLPANLGLMVDPKAEYAVARVANHVVIVAEARLLPFAERLGVTAEPLGSIRGAELVGAIFAGPFGNDSRVVDGSPYVSMTDGTGIVHTAPGHGTEDFLVGARSGLGVYCPVDEGGRFTPEVPHFAGRSVLEVNDDIIRWLAEQNVLLQASTFTHSYPHCWRCRKPVIFRATDQWFMIVDHEGHRDRCFEQLENHVRWEPESSRNRIREAVRNRPDWCLSRQRSWGVGIPAVYCEACGVPSLDARVVKRAAQLVREANSDTWYERPIEDFLPQDYACPACHSTGPFRKEEDVLDVWFDSGNTHRAIQALHPELQPAWSAARAGQGEVVYFEGPDQHRGWFNSSLMVGVGVENVAPYTLVATHGWVLDGAGRAMHKSLGNVISPLTIIEKYGADIVRWWALATDWRADVRVGDEILQRVADAYRKVRNTLRFLLGNLADFTPASTVPYAQLTAVDRAFADHLAARFARVRAEWAALQFHRALDQVVDLCTVDLSAVFLDVAKDRLYTLAADDPARRSAQTVLWQALHDLTLAVSPALVFTADEAWHAHPGLLAECDSVHAAEWPKPGAADRSSDEWLFLRAVRDTVNAAIEPLRASKLLATTAEAEVTLHAPEAWQSRLARYGEELPALLIVAAIELRVTPDGAEPSAEVRKTDRDKCDRCWMFRTDVGHDPAQPGLCSRCTSALATKRP